MSTALGNLGYNTFEEQTLEDLSQHQHPPRVAEMPQAPAAQPAEEIQSVSRGKKAVAACSGAFVTSILMAPFDVVKTRLMLQEPLADSAKAGPSSAPFAQPTLACCRVAQPGPTRGDFSGCLYTNSKASALNNGATQRYLRSGAAAHPTPLRPPLSLHHVQTISTCAFADPYAYNQALSAHRYPQISFNVQGLYPSDTRTTQWKNGAARAQQAVQGWFQSRAKAMPQPRTVVLEPPPRLNGMIDGFVQVGSREGVRGLWRGLSPTILMTVPSQVTYMVCYDFLKQHVNNAYRTILPSTPSSQPITLTAEQLTTSLVAGATARSISATLVSPLELIRTRLIGNSQGNMRANLSQLATDAKAKPASLWRGLGPTLYRDVPFSAIYFAAYETIKRSLTGGSGLGERRVSPDGTHSHSSEFAVAFVSGASAGILAAFLTHPFDLVKTRRQASTTHGAQSTWTLVRNVYYKEGPRGLFRGLSPRIAKVGPACGVMIGSFEVVGRLLDA